jgi:cyclophilin family peptidyl-prolyl cis-trans isomerase
MIETNANEIPIHNANSIEKQPQEQIEQEEEKDETKEIIIHDNHDNNSDETREKKESERKVPEIIQPPPPAAAPDEIVPEQLLPRPQEQLQPRNYRRIQLVLSNLKRISEDDTTTTEGTVLFELHPEWAPIGVERVRTLLEQHFYDQARFFRVLPKFVVQFGIAADPMVQKQWQHATLRDDDPYTTTEDHADAIVGNVRGTVTFATSGKHSRTTQLFINTGNNHHLDREGFTPIGKIISGMEYVDRIQDEYREQPKQHLIVTRGNAYLQEQFPHLSYISSVQIVHDDIREDPESLVPPPPITG